MNFLLKSIFNPIIKLLCRFYSGLKPKMVQVGSLQSARMNFGCALVRNVMYAVGGSTEDTSLNSVEMFDLESNRWMEIAQLKQRRKKLGVCVLKNAIYAIGGICDTQPLSSGTLVTNINLSYY